MSKALDTVKRSGDVDASKPKAQSDGATTQPAAPRFEFGSAEDFQLMQAMNQLKGQPVIASTKAVSAQVKSQ